MDDEPGGVACLAVLFYGFIGIILLLCGLNKFSRTLKPPRRISVNKGNINRWQND